MPKTATKLSKPTDSTHYQIQPRESRSHSLADTCCDLLSICRTMDLLLRPGSLCRSTTIGARVAPFSPVGCTTATTSLISHANECRQHKEMSSELRALTSTGWPMRLFSTADLPAPCTERNKPGRVRSVGGRREVVRSRGGHLRRCRAQRR
jgi:hypothetical protein